MNNIDNSKDGENMAENGESSQRKTEVSEMDGLKKLVEDLCDPERLIRIKDPNCGKWLTGEMNKYKGEHDNFLPCDT